MMNHQVPLADVILRIQSEGGSGNFLIIEDEVTGYYVQIAGSIGSPQLHAEAVSNGHLDVTRWLSPDQHVILERLGWTNPTKDCPNHFIDCQIHDADGREWLAGLIMKTFSEAYGLGSRAVLQLQITLEGEQA
ncbi:MAG TPA: hypothetical protein PKM25_00630 [Candidatus Ozemobacteraceae bacterium]|nr:hypothetical protein [Candidatus Ozemobacteraceae bacterium]